MSSESTLSEPKASELEQQDSEPHSLKQFVWFNLIVWVVIEGMIRVGQSFTFGKPTAYLLIDLSDTLTGFFLCFAIRPWLSRYVKQISIYTIVTALVASLLAAIVWQLIHTEVYIAVFPQEPRADTFLQSLKGLRFPFYLFLVWCGAFAFWQNNVWVVKEQKRRLQAERFGKQAVLNNLQSKLAPHFIFNTLNSAYALAIEEGAEKTQKQLYTMAELIRKSVNMSNQLYWTLEEELAFAREYLDMEKSRFGARLQVQIQADPRLELQTDPRTSNAIKIPTMLIQPLLENVIVHNVATSANTIRLEMAVSENDGHVRFRVRNNLGQQNGNNNLSSEQQTRTMGSSINNLRARLNALYSHRAQCRIDATDSHFQIEVQIPMEAEN